MPQLSKQQIKQITEKFINQDQNVFTNEQIYDIVCNTVSDHKLGIEIGEYQNRYDDCLIYFYRWGKYAKDVNDGGIIQLSFDSDDQNLSVGFRNNTIGNGGFSDTFDYKQIVDDKNILKNYIIKMILFCVNY